MREQRLQHIRVSLGVFQREVYADGPFDAAHKCGLGSGDIERATFEIVEPLIPQASNDARSDTGRAT